jgi:hypothetical protein
MPNPKLIRQSFLGANSEYLLSHSRAAIVGLGGGGSHIVQQLAHVGVGQFLLFDPDVVDESNLNRLVGATADDARHEVHKTEVARRVIRSLNHDAEVIERRELWQSAGEDLRGADVIFGSVDTFLDRDQLEHAARRYLIPYIDIGMDVHKHSEGISISGQVALSMPGGHCLWCMGILNEARLAQEASEYGAAGGRPQVIWPNGVLASSAVGIFIQLLTPWSRRQSEILLEYDGDLHTVQPSNRLEYLKNKACSHFTGLDGLADPFFTFPTVDCP